MSLDKWFSKLLYRMTGVLEIELPRQESLDDYLDFILTKIKPWSEDLAETPYWHGKRWLEICDDFDFVEDILHIFNPDGELLVSVDGNIIKGSWRQVAGTNGIIIDTGEKAELYDLAFLNDQFLILTKHGDQLRLKNKKYFVLAHEPSAARLNWRQLMEELYNVHRGNINYTIVLGLILFLIVLALFLSFY